MNKPIQIQKKSLKVLSKFTRFFFAFSIIFGGVLFFSGEAMAADYYVDSSIIDTNPASANPDFTTYDHTTFATTGGSDSVFKTIADINAFSALQPGDNIYFERGETWNEELVIPSSGNLTDSITFGAYGSGEKPIIDGENTRVRCIDVNNRNYITIENIHIKNATDKNFLARGTTDGIVFNNGISTGGASGFFINAGEGNSITNSIIHQGSSYGIALYSGINTNPVITGNTFVGVAGSSHTTAFFLRYAPGINFSDNTITNWSTANVYDTLVSFLHTDRVTFFDNTLTDCEGSVVSFESTTQIFGDRNSVVGSKDTNYIFTGASSGHFENSVVDNGSGHGFTVKGTSSIIFTNCTAKNGTRDGFRQVDSAVLTAVNCVANNNKGDGFGANENGKMECTGCKAYNNGVDDSLPSGDGYTAHANAIFNIYNSIAYGNYKSGVAMTGNSTGEIFNSVFYNNFEPAYGDGWDSCPDVGFATNSENNWTIKNCISMNNPVEFQITNEALVGGGQLISDYNNFYNGSENSSFYYNASSYNFTNWLIESSQDGNSLGDVNPLFVDASSHNFTLLWNSPAIDAGADVSLTTDYAGNPIYGAPDIGAYEYQPPYTIGTNEIDTAGDARIYADGKFRNTSTAGGTTANLSITPTGGFGAGDYSEWMNISNVTWDNTGPYHKVWTESSTYLDLTNTLHTVGDLEASKYYNVKVDDVLGSNIIGDDCASGACLSNSSGEIVFTYTGTYSDHTFDVEEGDNTAPVCLAGSPTSALSSGTTQTTLSLTTDETATCKYSTTANTAYGSMTDFTTTNDTSHSTTISGLSDGNSYSYYVKCRDAAGNTNSTDYIISFSVAADDEEEEQEEYFPNDGKIYKNLKNTSSSSGKVSYSKEPSLNDLISLKITPSFGEIEITIEIWNTSGDYYKKWKEDASSQSIISEHTIGDLKANTSYQVFVDGELFGTYASNSSGEISFTYDKGYSEKTFEVKEEIAGAEGEDGSLAETGKRVSLIFYLFSLLSATVGAVLYSRTVLKKNQSKR